jgi:hypothetical protein
VLTDADESPMDAAKGGAGAWANSYSNYAPIVR